MTTNIFNHLEGGPQFIEVDMNGVDILLPASGKAAIGTQNLNGCTSIVILGDAIILAHISPRPTSGPASAEEHHQQWLTRTHNLFAKYRNFFPQHTTTWGVFARVGGEPMEHIVHQVGGYLRQIGLPMQPAFYDVARADTRTAAAGQLVAVVRPKGTELYLENRMLQEKDRPRVTANAVAGPSTQNTQATRSIPSSSRPSAKHSDVHASKAPAAAMTDSEPQWLYQDGTYFKLQGRTVVEQRSTPPENQRILHKGMGLYMTWDGTNRWMYREGKWVKF